MKKIPYDQITNYEELLTRRVDVEAVEINGKAKKIVYFSVGNKIGYFMRIIRKEFNETTKKEWDAGNAQVCFVVEFSSHRGHTGINRERFYLNLKGWKKWFWAEEFIMC